MYGFLWSCSRWFLIEYVHALAGWLIEYVHALVGYWLSMFMLSLVVD